ncbi:MAG: multicopper oxidase domain-containing protein, partial [Methyloligellaceae bacterium]
MLVLDMNKMHACFQTRRQFLTSAGATAALLSAGRLSDVSAALPYGPILLEARPGTANLLETAETETAIWGYDGGVPGPVLRAKQGGEVWVRLKNNLSQPTTIHWHGIRIDNAMD